MNYRGHPFCEDGSGHEIGTLLSKFCIIFRFTLVNKISAQPNGKTYLSLYEWNIHIYLYVIELILFHFENATYSLTNEM